MLFHSVSKYFINLLIYIFYKILSVSVHLGSQPVVSMLTVFIFGLGIICDFGPTGTGATVGFIAQVWQCSFPSAP